MALILFMCLVFTGSRLPWLRVEWTWYVRMFVAFPLLLATFIYLGFVGKLPSGRSSYQTMLASTGRGWKRASLTFWLVLGMLLVPGFLCYSSYVFPAWAANIVSREAWHASFRVADVKARSGPVWSLYYEAYLTETNSGQEAILPLGRSVVEESGLRANDTICARGRSSMFGAIVTDIARNQTPCR